MTDTLDDRALDRLGEHAAIAATSCDCSGKEYLCSACHSAISFVEAAEALIALARSGLRAERYREALEVQRGWLFSLDERGAIVPGILSGLAAIDAVLATTDKEPAKEKSDGD